MENQKNSLDNLQKGLNCLRTANEILTGDLYSDSYNKAGEEIIKDNKAKLAEVYETTAMLVQQVKESLTLSSEIKTDDQKTIAFEEAAKSAAKAVNPPVQTVEEKKEETVVAEESKTTSTDTVPEITKETTDVKEETVAEVTDSVPPAQVDEEKTEGIVRYATEELAYAALTAEIAEYMKANKVQKFKQFPAAYRKALRNKLNLIVPENSPLAQNDGKGGFNNKTEGKLGSKIGNLFNNASKIVRLDKVKDAKNIVNDEKAASDLKTIVNEEAAKETTKETPAATPPAEEPAVDTPAPEETIIVPEETPDVSKENAPEETKEENTEELKLNALITLEESKEESEIKESLKSLLLTEKTSEGRKAIGVEAYGILHGRVNKKDESITKFLKNPETIVKWFKSLSDDVNKIQKAV